MIPWHTFKTPQDAYEWAKGATSVLMLAACPKTGDTVLVRASQVWGGYIGFVSEGRSTRHGLICNGDLIR